MEAPQPQDKEKKPVTFEEAMKAMFPNLVTVDSVHQGTNRAQRRQAKFGKKREK